MSRSIDKWDDRVSESSARFERLFNEYIRAEQRVNEEFYD